MKKCNPDNFNYIHTFFSLPRLLIAVNVKEFDNRY